MIFLFLSSLSDEHAANSPKAPPAREIADPENDFPELDELLRRAKEGDGDAFSDLVVHYERFVYNTAVRVLSASGQSSDLADDIAQDSFIKAWRNLTQFRGECTFSTWLFRVTVNTAKDAIRSAARRPTVSLSYPDGDDEDGYAEWDVPVTSGDEIPEEVLEKKELILGHGLALWDSIASCVITGSSDASIRDVRPNDLRIILDHSPITDIYCNGKKSYEMYNRYILPSIGREAVCLPSTSPANAQWSLEKLIAAWSVICDKVPGQPRRPGTFLSASLRILPEPAPYR